MNCAELIATRDWATTAVGPRSMWPISLRALVEAMLHTRQPMLLFWGENWTQFYNDAFVPSFGQGKHPAAMGQSARECWTDAWPVVGAQLEAVSRGEAAWYEDTLVPIFRNGRMEEVFWTYSYSPAYDDNNAIAGVLVIVTEMTGRVLAARRLAALASLNLSLSSATTHDAVLDAVFAVVGDCARDIPFLAADVRGRRRATSDVSLDISASGRSELEHPIPIDIWPEPVAHVFSTRTPLLNMTFGLSPRLPHDDAYLGFLTQIADQAGNALRRVEDAHEQARSDAERTSMLSALDEANRAKDEFLAMLGHELRNPLATIVAAVDLMKAKQTQETVERASIERQVHHVARLVDDLLDVSRITRGTLELARAPTDIGDVVSMAVGITETLITQSRHELTVAVAAGLTLDADPTRLVQVVSNLLLNAARYTPVGGSIRVEARREQDDIVIRVIDNGRGIPSELVPRIFDLFVQGKRSPDRSEGGLGIGLAVVKNLVGAHGGTVGVHSDGEGAGATFTVRLPAAKPAATAPPSRTLPVTTSRKRVLLVDDNEDAVQLLGEVVRRCGHDVLIAHHPDVALEQITDFVPDIAVVDIGLPGIDGYELGRRILGRYPQCRIVAVTGYGQPSDRQRSTDAGFFAHLVKPVRMNVLLELLG